MKAKCYLCEEWFSPTERDYEAWVRANYDWDPANWLCPGCEEALKAIRRDLDEACYEDEEDYEYPF